MKDGIKKKVDLPHVGGGVAIGLKKKYRAHPPDAKGRAAKAKGR